MEYKDIRENLEEMMNDNYKDFIKALVSIEKGVNDEKALEEVYVLYMNNDTTGLLSDDFDYMIDDMKEQGKIVENVSDIEEKDDLINLVGNIAGQVENLERENANGEKFKVSNFSIVSKDDYGNKIYTNCSAYRDKTKDIENLKQGDFVKIFGQVKTSIDNNGKEHKNVRILSSKLLKAKEKALRQTIKLNQIRKTIAKVQRDKYRQSSDCLYFFVQFNAVNHIIERNLCYML